MTKRKGKPVSFDAMVKFFMHNYNIPTKRDIDGLNLVMPIAGADRGHYVLTVQVGDGVNTSATETVLDLIKRSKNGIGIADVRKQTGYDDKKLRNIFFRLNKTEKITRVSRGSYEAVE